MCNFGQTMNKNLLFAQIGVCKIVQKGQKIGKGYTLADFAFIANIY